MNTLVRIAIDMEVFESNWKHCNETTRIAEHISSSNGNIVTMLPHDYITWLNEFAIPYKLYINE